MSPVSKESTETISLSSSVSSFADVAPRYFEHWHDLLDACTDYARASGWRYTPVDFMRELDVGGAERAGVACRAASTTVVLDWAERVAAVAREQTEGAAECDLGEWAQRLLEEFRLCERLVAQEAVFNSMLSTCRALGLCKPNAAISTAAAGSMVGSLAGVDGCAWQDMSVSLEHVARRLDNFVLMIEREPRIKAQRSDRPGLDRRNRHRTRRLACPDGSRIGPAPMESPTPWSLIQIARYCLISKRPLRMLKTASPFPTFSC